MSSIKVYNQEGKEIGKLELNEAIFGLSWNGDLVHQALAKILANSRQILANTKDRAQVSGGGKKPWKQKGTGRARHGSIRSPLWKGGGVSFGPTSARNFTVTINKKMAQKALLTVLSAKLKDNELIILDDLRVASPKTKEMTKILASFSQISSGLFILDKKDESLLRASANLPKIKVITIDNLNLFYILKYQHVILTKPVVDYLNKTYGKAEAKENKVMEKIKVAPAVRQFLK